MNPALRVWLLWQRAQQTQLKPGFLFVLMNPAKLGKLGSRTQLTWVTYSLGLEPSQNPGLTWVEPSYQYQGMDRKTDGQMEGQTDRKSDV